jgi:hypothetical protein
MDFARGDMGEERMGWWIRSRTLENGGSMKQPLSGILRRRQFVTLLKYYTILMNYKKIYGK